MVPPRVGRCASSSGVAVSTAAPAPAPAGAGEEQRHRTPLPARPPVPPARAVTGLTTAAGGALRGRRLTASALGPEPTRGAAPPPDGAGTRVAAASPSSSARFPYISGASEAGAAGDTGLAGAGASAGVGSPETVSLTLMIGVPTSTVTPTGKAAP